MWADGAVAPAILPSASAATSSGTSPAVPPPHAGRGSTALQSTAHHMFPHLARHAAHHGPAAVAAWALLGAGVGLAVLSFCTLWWFRRRRRPLFPNEAAVDAEMAVTYNRLADRLLQRLHTCPSQWWVAIAGGPGAGKSTLATAVAALINERARADVAVVLPMDGFHFSRAELKAMAEANGTSGPTFDDLIARRGSPWTFDARALCSALRDARRHGEAALPVYSRQKSDPVPGGVHLRKHHRIVLVEGNYLLMYNDPRWAPLRDLFDERWFLRCLDLEDQRQRLISRHLETWTPEKDRMWGPGRAGAAAKADSNDVLNIHTVNATARYADLTIDSLTD